MQNNQHEHLKYRPEIDGLRAIAVGVVLLYHAKLAMPGGFVGVDVFFVISGFLITSLILKDYESDDGFSIVRFWERRVRRIFPALIFVVIVTAVAGWFVLLPSDFLDLGKSVVAQAVFGSNFYFWDTSGYFESSAWIRPLLHTWSLAVEEQFYLLLPLLFLFRSRWNRKALRWGFGVVIVLSLVLSIIQADRSPDTGFYLLPSRAWELLAGAMLALFPIRNQLPKWIAELVGWSGLVGIGLACLLYTHSTPFPGAAALLPVLGTVAIIWSSGCSAEPNILCRVLSLRPLVFIGKISYSLYLWHWPILVYALYWRDNHIMHWPYRLALLGLSFLLAIISWKFVETPFRIRKVFPSRKGVLGFGFVSLMIYAGGGLYIVGNNGCPTRYSEAVVSIDSGSEPFAFSEDESSSLTEATRGGFLVVGKAAVSNETPIHCLVWGDSHAMALRPAFDQLGKEYAKTVHYAAHLATCPVLGYESFDETSLREESNSWARAIIDHVRVKQIPHVVIIANWDWYFKHEQVSSHEAFSRMLANTVVAIQEAGAKVWICKEVPNQIPDFRITMAKALLQGKPTDVGISKSNHMKASQAEDKILALPAENGAHIIDLSSALFTERGTSQLEVNGKSLYFDATHLSKEGALFLKGLFTPIFKPNLAAGE